MAHTNGGGMVGPPGGYGHHAQEEDVLSYSSTEQEASIHEQLGTSQLGGSGHLNLSFNNGKFPCLRLFRHSNNQSACNGDISCELRLLSIV